MIISIPMNKMQHSTLILSVTNKPFIMSDLTMNVVTLIVVMMSVAVFARTGLLFTLPVNVRTAVTKTLAYKNAVLIQS